jgi:hypothetical protein
MLINKPPKSEIHNILPKTSDPDPSLSSSKNKSSWKRRLGWLGGLMGLFLLVLLVYLLAVRPWYLQWGTKGDESTMVLPGDELLPNPAYRSTLAITINAPADKVWPWLLQLGYKRGGWYSYDVVENALGVAAFVDGHTTNRIVPELQNLKVGDRINIAWETAPVYLKVAKIEPGNALILRWTVEGSPDNGPLWNLIIKSTGPEQTRLLMRMVLPTNADLPTMISEPGVYAMYHKMMVGIKERVERNWRTQTTGNER